MVTRGATARRLEGEASVARARRMARKARELLVPRVGKGIDDRRVICAADRRPFPGALEIPRGSGRAPRRGEHEHYHPELCPAHNDLWSDRFT